MAGWKRSGALIPLQILPRDAATLAGVPSSDDAELGETAWFYDPDQVVDELRPRLFYTPSTDGTAYVPVGAGSNGGITISAAANKFAGDLLTQIRQIDTPYATMPIDETDPWDIHYWMPREEIIDSRRQNGPTINTTNRITYVLGELMSKFVGQPNPATPGASRGMELRFHHTLLVDGFRNWPSAIMPRGDSMRETIFQQSTTPVGHMFSVTADQGQASGGRSSYWQAEDFSILMRPTRVGPGPATGPTAAVVHGIDFQVPADNLAYEAGILTRVTITGASGIGINVPLKRHGPKIRFCYVNGCGGVDTSVAQDGSGYAPNMYIGSNSDAEILHCGSGSGKGHSLHVHNCETTQVKGGDYWASSNADKDYRAMFLEGFDYGIFEGFDCNGAIEYHGHGAAKSSQVRFLGINFRFRPTSFGADSSDDPGFQPPPLNGFLILKDSVGSISEGCHFTPSYDPGGTVNARPMVRYYVTGVTMHHACDPLHDVLSNDWDCGANPDGTLIIPTEQNSITNDATKITLHAPSVSTSQASGTLSSVLRFLPGTGILGRKDGSVPPSGFAGERGVQKIGSGSAVGLTTNTAADVTTITLQPGEYDLSACAELASPAAATVTRFEICVSTSANFIDSSDARFYAGESVSATGVTGPISKLELTGMPISISATTTFHLSVRSLHSSGVGSVGAYGGLWFRRFA
jgi:hypothetical protein